MGRFLNLYKEKNVPYIHLAFSYQEDNLGRFDPVLFQTQSEAEAARIAGVSSLNKEFGVPFEGAVIDLENVAWRER